MATEVTAMVDEKVEAPETIWAVQVSSGEWVQTWPAYARENGGVEYVRVVRVPDTRQRAERAVAKIVTLLIDHEADHPLGGYPRQSMADIIAAEFER